MRCILGVDFDNTLINYDDVLWKTAQRMGFITEGVMRHKKNIRDAIRSLPDGENKWQQVQAHVYGKTMDQAVLMDGVKHFFELCKSKEIGTYIISHKTEFAAADGKSNLRRAALDWMESQGFFDETGLGLSRSQVYFESTREEKLQRIKKLGCTHFIDDLEETFLENSFPRGVEKLLYGSYSQNRLLSEMKVFATWKEIKEYFCEQGTQEYRTRSA